MYYLKVFLCTLLSCVIWLLPAQYNIDGLFKEYQAQIRSLQEYSFFLFLPDTFYRQHKESINKLTEKENGKVVGQIPGRKRVAVAFKNASKAAQGLARQAVSPQLLTRKEFVAVLDFSFKERIFAWCIIVCVTTFLFAKLSAVMYP